MSAFAPTTLTTPRLLLRPLTDADVSAIFAIFSDPEVMRYWSSPPLTELSEAHEMILHALHGYQTGDSLRLGIERRSDGVLMGTCTLFHHHAASRRAEIGYAQGRPYWGAGYMHEALSALIDHAFGPLGLHRLEADIDPLNTASARTLERLGFQKEGHLRERWLVAGVFSDTGWYGLLRHEWRGNAGGGAD